MKKKTTGCVILAAMLLVTSSIFSPALAQSADPYLIVPGQSLGELSFKMSVQEFRAKLGEPTGVDLLELPSGFVMLYWWRERGIGIATSPAEGENPVFLILLFLSAEQSAMKYRTVDTGLGLGSFRTLIIATYGKPVIHDGELLYFANGLVFGFLEGANQANVVGVWRHIPRPTPPPPATSTQSSAPSAGPTNV